MAHQDRQYASAEAERCQIRSGQDLRNGNTCPEPDESVAQYTCFSFIHFCFLVSKDSSPFGLQNDRALSLYVQQLVLRSRDGVGMVQRTAALSQIQSCRKGTGKIGLRLLYRLCKRSALRQIGSDG